MICLSMMICMVWVDEYPVSNNGLPCSGQGVELLYGLHSVLFFVQISPLLCRFFGSYTPEY